MMKQKYDTQEKERIETDVTSIKKLDQFELELCKNTVKTTLERYESGFLGAQVPRAKDVINVRGLLRHDYENARSLLNSIDEYFDSIEEYYCCCFPRTDKYLDQLKTDIDCATFSYRKKSNEIRECVENFINSSAQVTYPQSKAMKIPGKNMQDESSEGEKDTMLTKKENQIRKKLTTAEALRRFGMDPKNSRNHVVDAIKTGEVPKMSNSVLDF